MGQRARRSRRCLASAWLALRMPSTLGNIVPPIRRAEVYPGLLQHVAVSVSPVYLRRTSMPKRASAAETVDAAAIGAHIGAARDRAGSRTSLRVVTAQLFWKATSSRPRSSTVFQPRLAAWNGSGACVMATSTREASSRRSSRGPSFPTTTISASLAMSQPQRSKAMAMAHSSASCRATTPQRLPRSYSRVVKPGRAETC